MINNLSFLLKINYRTVFRTLILAVIFTFSLIFSYPLFHTTVELVSIVVAFTVFVITWNSRNILENQYLYFVGIAYLFVGCLDLLHTLTYKGLNIFVGETFYANQFWIATRILEALTLVVGFYFLKNKKKINADLLFTTYLVITVLIVLSILYWKIFPDCFIEGQGQTIFKIYAEYFIIAVLALAAYLLNKRKNYFDPSVVKLLAFSIVFTALSEFSFTLYVANDSLVNATGHFFKLASFYLIYKANVETGFTKPTALLFKSIKESEIRYRTLSNNLPVLIFRFDNNFICSYTNANQPGLITVNLLTQIQAEIEKYLKELSYGNTSKKINITLQEESEKFTYSIDLILENNQAIAEEQTYLVLCQDITKLKLAEERLTELNATKDKLFSIIAHDLKNPFTTILASSDLINRAAHTLSPDKIQNIAARSKEAATTAYSLLENLLNWSMVQTGALKAQPEIIIVKDLIEKVIKNALPTASNKGIQITPPHSPNFKCYADTNMMETVFRNLISNAIKFSYPNGVITISAEERDQNILFSVTDYGVGIEEKNIANLFSNNNTNIKLGTAKEKGTGLGLQLCKDFINLNGGDLSVKSKFGEGTSFMFTIPKVRD